MEQIDKWEMIVKSASAQLSSNVNVNSLSTNSESRSYFLMFISRTEKEEDDILYIIIILLFYFINIIDIIRILIIYQL